MTNLRSAYAQGAGRAGVLRVMPQADLKVLDPIWTTAAITLEHGYLIYDKLFERNAAGIPQPQMAESHTVSDDRLTHEITLRDGLQFHDEAPVTAADVVQSLKRWGQRDSFGTQLFAVVSGIEAVDDKTVRITLSEPFPGMEMALSSIRGNPPFIMPARVAETPIDEQITEYVGSGPFMFREDLWRRGSLVVYDKAPMYVPRDEPQDGYAGGKVAHFDRIEFVYIPDYNTALNAIAAGETDIWELLPNDYVPVIGAMPGVTAVRGMPAYGMFRPNSLFPPFDNPKARQALLHLIDQRELLTAITGDPEFFEVCPSYFACMGPYAFADEVPQSTVDIDRAKALLEEAGYDGSPVVVLDTTNIAALHTASLYLAQQLREAGMNVDLQAMDWGTTISRYPQKKGAADGGWSIFATYTSAVDTVSPLVHRYINSGEKAEPGWPQDDTVEELRTAWLATTDEAERVSLAKALQERTFETVPYIPWGQFYTARARRENIENFYGEAPVPIYWGITRAG
ncbi:ABC transporter substrate-binding protein [Acuticoccus sp. M5D2P5]|uniref:ABC transporter substrate-binding protein n=1 Tax=Acuticoccus kalidii TaxID=2910977 RepID=UPI001F33750F|nr:ABC transporter substrate-binding protein [Acuticoccus kalidii]MCF3933385.1 ABC transporter substrate-binding protein [Acuticoccus kalidii]